MATLMLRNLFISTSVAAKIAAADHGHVTREEVSECFENWDGRLCYEQRREHMDSQGNPTPWFVAKSNEGRELKIMYFIRSGKIHLKSAYPATSVVKGIFDRYGE